MTEQKNSPLKNNAKHNLDERAQYNAKTTDSRLIRLFRNLGKASRWGKDEIDLLADSAGDAFSTTKRITKKMIGHPKREVKWSSFTALADRANDGFLSIARSAGKTTRLIQSGTMGSLSKIENALSRGKKKESKQPGHTREVKERTPTDKSPEGSGSFPPGETTGSKESKQPGHTVEIKERAATAKAPEASGSSPPGATTESKESKQPGDTGEIKERAPTDKTPEGSGSPPPGETT